MQPKQKQACEIDSDLLQVHGDNRPRSLFEASEGYIVLSAEKFGFLPIRSIAFQ